MNNTSKKNKYIKLILIISINLVFFISLYTIIVNKLKEGWEPEIPFLKEKANYEVELDINNYPHEDYPKDFIRLNPNEDKKIFEELFQRNCGEDRIEINTKKNENHLSPIIVFGCSYAYGHALKKNESFSYILSQYTGRQIYNFATCGSEAVSSYNKYKNYIKQNSLSDEIKKIDTYIYVYMYDHISRYLNINFMVEEYNNIFKTSKFERIINKLYLAKYINAKIKRQKICNGYPFDKSEEYTKQVMKYLYNEIKNQNKNAKLYIIIYDEKIPYPQYSVYHVKFLSDLMNSPIWKELEEETNGQIQIVHTKDVTGLIFDKI